MPFVLFPYLFKHFVFGEASSLGGLLDKKEENKKPSIPVDEKDE